MVKLGMFIMQVIIIIWVVYIILFSSKRNYNVFTDCTTHLETPLLHGVTVLHHNMLELYYLSRYEIGVTTNSLR